MNYSRVINEIFSQFTGPRFGIKLWDGTERYYGSGTSTIFTLVIDDAKTAQRLLHQFKHVRRSFRLILATFLATRSMPKDREDQIAYHYDLGNDFFKMILDHETMSYSAGLYESESDDLESAQKKKIALVCKWLNLPSGSSILDLGSGWGGFAKYAAQKKNWRVTGYTLSNAQLEYCRQLVKTDGLEKSISFKYQDMIVDLPVGQFDGIVTIESIEHVGKERLPQFFSKLHERLKPGGALIIQLTGRYKPRSVDHWT